MSILLKYLLIFFFSDILYRKWNLWLMYFFLRLLTVCCNVLNHYYFISLIFQTSWHCMLFGFSGALSLMMKSVQLRRLVSVLLACCLLNIYGSYGKLIFSTSSSSIIF